MADRKVQLGVGKTSSFPFLTALSSDLPQIWVL